MYTFVQKNILHNNNNKVLSIKCANMMFDVLKGPTLQLKIIDDLSMINIKFLIINEI
jgi:hypothetical protein